MENILLLTKIEMVLHMSFIGQLEIPECSKCFYIPILRLLSNDALPDMLIKTLDINCIKMENGCLVPGPSSALGIKWIKDVWDHIVTGCSF
jgi:hypothetical protein